MKIQKAIMTQTVRWLLLSGSTMMSFIYAATSPSVHVHFMQLVSVQILAAANIIGIGLAAIVNSTVSSLRDLYHKWFLLIVVADVICFWMISFFGIECPTIRFLGFSVLNAVSTTLWVTVIRDSVNSALNGAELTNWQAKSGAFGLYGAFAGGLVAIFVPNINVEFCILLQCISNMFMGITDLIAYRKMQRGFKELRSEREI